jgi:DNA-binding HxlR family transcriptional regulator
MAATRGSRTGRPIMVVLDVLGRRWALRIMWELRSGALTFRALRERCDEISPSVLSARISDLRQLGVVELAEAGYALTAQGQELGELLAPIDDWARRSLRRAAKA